MSVKLMMDPVETAAIKATRLDLTQRQDIIDAFHRLSYDERARGKSWGAVSFRGYPVWKTPQDLWLYRDVIMRTRPMTIVETGTANGGSALYFASLLDEIGKGGTILTIDIKKIDAAYPVHPRIFYAPEHSSLDGIPPRIKTAEGATMTAPTQLQKPVMVVLDSAHERDHVRKELDVYAPLVSEGQYMVVEDTNVNGNPVLVEHGPGPKEALDDWLPQEDWRIDKELYDRYLFSYHTWLRHI
jgi:cephalosporin hydroxylase